NGLWLAVGICRCKQQRGFSLPIARRLGTAILTRDINAPQVSAQITGDNILSRKLPFCVDDSWGRQTIRHTCVTRCEIDPSGINPEIVDTLNPLAIRAWGLQAVEEHDEKHGMPCRAIVAIPKHCRPSPIRHPYERRLAKRKSKVG